MTDQASSAVIVRPACEEDWDWLWPLLVGMGQVDAAGNAVRRFRRVIWSVLTTTGNCQGLKRSCATLLKLETVAMIS